MRGGSLPAITVRIASAGDCGAIASVEDETNGIDAARAFARCVEQTADPAVVRRGAGLALTARRLEWIADRADRAYYFANARNDASIALHRRLGFVERTRDFWFPRTRIDGGEGILFEVALPAGGSRPG